MNLPKSLLACCLLAATVARADGDCHARPSTPAELAFAAKVRGLAKALPKAPAGWTADDVDVNAAGESMCTEGDAELKSGLNRLTGSAYVLFRNGEDRSALMEKAAAVQNDPKDQKRIDELIAENAKVAEAAGAAVGKNDMAAAQRHMERAKAIGDEVARLSEKAQKKRGAILEEMQRDMFASVAVHVGNVEWSVGCEKNAQLKVPGAAAAYRSNCPAQSGRSGGDPDVDGETTIFYGPWTTKVEDGTLSAKAKVEAPYTAARTAIVVIRANEQRAKELLEKIDLAAVKAAVR